MTPKQLKTLFIPPTWFYKSVIGIIIVLGSIVGFMAKEYFRHLEEHNVRVDSKLDLIITQQSDQDKLIDHNSMNIENNSKDIKILTEAIKSKRSSHGYGN